MLTSVAQGNSASASALSQELPAELPARLSPTGPVSTHRFQQFAAFLVVYLLGVILFGAWVRVTGSGAGCGESWPTCNGQLIPRTPSQKTMIEFGHRLTSGVLGPLILALPIWARRKFPAGHVVRRCSWAMVVLVIVEAAIGAGLVLGGLVDQNDSWARALAVVLHLGNTLLLMACAALAVGCSGVASGSVAKGSLLSKELSAEQLSSEPQVSKKQWQLSVLFLVVLSVVSCLGAITALGDTLFPVGSRAAEQAGGTHWLIRLRIVHPLVASAAVFGGVKLAESLRAVAALQWWAQTVIGLLVVQLLVGIVNIALHAPGWLQLLHLLVGQLLWMSTVVLVYRAHQIRRAGLAVSARVLVQEICTGA